MKFSQLVVLAFFAVSAATPSLAWEVVEGWRDPISGNSYTAATDANSDGYSIHIFRDLDGKVRAVYSIPPSSFDRVPMEGRVLAIRPDNHSSVIIEAEIIKGKYVENARSDGQHIRDLIWHGQEPSPTRGTLRNILDSQSLHARFFTDTGSTVDTSWSLKGSPEAIAAAIGINVNASQAEIDWSNLVTDLMLSSTQRCGTDMDCLGAVTECMDLITGERRESDAFNVCVGKITMAP